MGIEVSKKEVFFWEQVGHAKSVGAKVFARPEQIEKLQVLKTY